MSRAMSQLEQVMMHVGLVQQWHAEGVSLREIGERLYAAGMVHFLPVPMVILRALEKAKGDRKDKRKDKPPAPPVVVIKQEATPPVAAQALEKAMRHATTMSDSGSMALYMREQLKQLEECATDLGPVLAAARGIRSRPLNELLYDGVDELTGEPIPRSSRELASLLQVYQFLLRACEVETKVVKTRADIRRDMMRATGLLQDGGTREALTEEQLTRVLAVATADEKKAIMAGNSAAFSAVCARAGL